MIDPFDDEYFMNVALRLAQKAEKAGEIPVGALVVSGNQIIGKGYNQTERLNDSTAHAEMIAITSAFQYIGAKYLSDCRLYVTLEPCVMCAGAMHWAQIDQLFYGTKDPQKGYSMFRDPKGRRVIHSRTKVKSGIMEYECRKIVEDFFKRLREKG